MGQVFLTPTITLSAGDKVMVKDGMLSVVVFARITKNKGLLLEQFNMFDDKVASHTIPNVRAFVTMTMAPLQGDGGEQVVLLFERGKETMQAIVDVSLKTTRFDSLGAVSAKKVWRLLVVRGAHGQLGFVPYTSLGGRFGVRDSRNAEQGKVTLPVSRCPHCFYCLRVSQNSAASSPSCRQ
jgi:hypothetical protein